MTISILINGQQTTDYRQYQFDFVQCAQMGYYRI